MTNFSLGLFNLEITFINVGFGKSCAVDKVLKFLNTTPLTQDPHDFFVCYVIDGIDILNKLNPKPARVKQSAYLVAVFNMAIDTQTNNTVAVIVTFDHYREISLNKLPLFQPTGK